MLIVGSFLVLAAPLVQTAGRGRAHLRRGAHSTCKLILEMCLRFSNIKAPKSSHAIYIYIYMIIIIIIELRDLICMLDFFEL